MRLIALVSLSFFALSAFGQFKVSGVVVDAATKEPLPFVNIVVDGTTQGTTSSIEGKFSFVINSGAKLRFSYVGYQSREITQTSSYLKIELQQLQQELKEVEILAGENPAHRIIRRVVAQRSANDPENLEAFQYRAYHKFYATVEGSLDSAELAKRGGKFLNNFHFFMNETYTERKFLKPSHDKEVVLGNRMSGVKDPFFAVLGTSFQPFTFYKDFIPLLDKQYLNPISRGTFDRYYFEIADTIFHESDSTYIITFEPFPGKRFEALKGQLHINTNGYALEHVLAEPADEQAMMTLRIQQKYRQISGHWFPNQLNTEFLLKHYKILDHPVKYVHRSYISSVEVNPLLNKKEFGLLAIEFAPGSTRQSETFWEESRLDSLSVKERNTYHLYDTLNPKAISTLNSLVNITESLVVGRFKVGAFYLPMEHLLRVNQYEGVRIGAGLRTNERISKRFHLEGYAAYGTRDGGFKYGGHLQFNFVDRKEFFLRAGYQRDVFEAGNHDFLQVPRATSTPERIRSWVSERMDSVERIQLRLHFRPLQFTEASFFARQQTHRPTYDYTYNDGERMLTEFTLVETGFQFQYIKGERFTQIGGSRVTTAFDDPQIGFSIARATEDYGGDFNYTRIEARIMQSFQIRGAGKTTFALYAGHVNGDAPYFSLFTGRGSNADHRAYRNLLAANYFQTVGAYEFLSSSYAKLFFSQHLGRILKTQHKHIRPELTLTQAVGFGQLEQPERHLGPEFATMEKGLYEGGAILTNIVRFEYMDVAYMGLGGGLFYRYGPYQLADRSDNIAAKLVLTFSF